ncbi:aryl hydrocarbon receptor-like [Callorhinchus milii]|uniref:aryl hydrocarbon receptor-like n=1 Tax=Callorhinchus milii TaxID=7868 RepID=UPI001C3FA106|nr:aryl hydrocarbon receptor-like [Callorhinchus milii]
MINSSLYAVRKRRRPMKQIKPSSPEGAKSNASKRHRERLNAELERLAGTLPFPEEVISRLDKLSILRLCVNYMRVKSFFEVSLPNPARTPATSVNNGHLDSTTSLAPAPAPGQSPDVPEGDLLLRALNGFVMIITTDGLVFYASYTIKNYLGFQQSDVVNQRVFELIHVEDREDFRRQLHWAFNPPPTKPGPTEPQGAGNSNQPPTLYEPNQLPPDNSEFLDRSFVCRFRCLLNNTSGFLALHFHGKLKFLHGQNKSSELGVSLPSPLALFTIAVPVQLPSIVEVQERTLIFRTKHKLDFTPLSCDTKTRLVLGWTEAELQVRSGYQFIHCEDMIYCAESHMRMIKTGESGMITFRILCRDGRYQWIQALARIVYKNSKPDCIISDQHPLTEAEGEVQLQRRLKQCGVFAWPKAASLYATPSVVPPQAHLSHSRGQDIKTEQGQFQEECTLHSMEEKILDEVTDILRTSELLELPHGEEFPAAPCNRGVAKGVIRPIDAGNYGEAYVATNTLDTALGLDAVVLEMLNDYGVTQKDLEAIPQDEQTKHVNFATLNGDDSFPSDILSVIECPMSSFNSSTESLSSYTEDPSFPLESGGKQIEATFCYQSPQVSNLSDTHLQINASDYIPNSTYFMSQSSMRLTRPVENSSRSYIHPPALNLPSIKVTNANPQLNLFNGQASCLHQPGIVKPPWSLSGEDPQGSDMVIPSGFLPKDVMRFIAPTGAQSLLCAGPSWGSVQ